MYSRIVFLIIMSGIFESVLFANEVRNGGSVLDCDGRLQVLDLYEAQTVWDLAQAPANSLMKNWDESANIRTVADTVTFVSQIFDRLEGLDQVRLSNYQATLTGLKQNSATIDRVILPAVNDFGPVSLPEGCSLLQAASQADVRFVGEKYFTFSSSIWERLSPLQKVALVVHETILFDERTRKETTSRSTRYLTGLLFSKKFSNLSADSYARLLNEAKISPPLKLSTSLRKIADIISKVSKRVVNTRVDGYSRMIKSVYLGQNTINVELTLNSSQSQAGSLGFETLLFFQVEDQIYLRLESTLRPLALPLQWIGKVTLNEHAEEFSWDISTTIPFDYKEICSVRVLGEGTCR